MSPSDFDVNNRPEFQVTASSPVSSDGENDDESEAPASPPKTPLPDLEGDWSEPTPQRTRPIQTTMSQSISSGDTRSTVESDQDTSGLETERELSFEPAFVLDGLDEAEEDLGDDDATAAPVKSPASSRHSDASSDSDSDAPVRLGVLSSDPASFSSRVSKTIRFVNSDLLTYQICTWSDSTDYQQCPSPVLPPKTWL